MFEIILASALVQGALFNPPIDRSLVQITEQVRRDGQGERVYRLERTLRFGRDEDGLFADLTLTRIEGTVDGGGFERGLAGLKDRTIRYRLDPQGRLLTIPGMDGHWAAFGAGLADANNSTMAQRAVAAIRGVPPAQQRAMLWSMIEPLLLADIAVQSPYSLRPVAQPGRAPFATGAMLTGTESLTRLPDGTLELRRMVSGSHDAALGDTSGKIDRDREATIAIDPATGLLAHSTETTLTRIGEAEQVTITRLTLREIEAGN